MKIKFIPVFVIATLFCSTNSYSQASDEIMIREILSSQEQAWNSGNIKEFMKGYWNSDSLTYIGKSGVTYGWQKTLDSYNKHYPDTTAMGNLTFTLLELKPLSTGYYFVIGQWHLQRTTTNLEGYFTLLFKKIGKRWFIVADHSS